MPTKKKPAKKLSSKPKKNWPSCSFCSQPSVMFNRKNGEQVHYCADHCEKITKDRKRVAKKAKK